jgi:hypothetical protein
MAKPLARGARQVLLAVECPSISVHHITQLSFLVCATQVTAPGFAGAVLCTNTFHGNLLHMAHCAFC